MGGVCSELMGLDERNKINWRLGWSHIMLILSVKRHVMEVTELFRDCDWARTD